MLTLRDVQDITKPFDNLILRAVTAERRWERLRSIISTWKREPDTVGWLNGFDRGCNCMITSVLDAMDIIEGKEVLATKAE